ncbi:SufD family Fe-S cluster assembly protein [Paraurantiacibacter namhicola]|uniref:FeS cluster assembly protein SufD n=1 Tax=Paraurantiacibacter namhicola TaxID=645517 RepID=A0A1C7D5Q8_9SPHN|nr:SufD family Fe-S cluster assembly protein [Paraurantiacibacter namhicola]ANU06797.1 FeS cluster assembly protein SufD [Paraurantiacibacter namhicola]
MTQSILLPTRKDEAWRYSDTDALEGMDLGRFDQWRDIEVPAGETYRELLVIEDEGGVSDDTLLTRLRVTIGKGARCELFAVIASGHLGRVETVVMLEDGAHFEFGGVTVGGRDTVREFVTRVAHEEPNATSNQVIRSVHWGQGTGNFLGRIDVVRDAQKTDAAQDFKGLLLEKGASVNAVPQLEIFADDVQCAHGATVGQLDESARYYMATRGLSPEQSRRLLVQAFIGDAFVALDDDEEARERLMRVALDKLDRHL